MPSLNRCSALVALLSLLSLACNGGGGDSGGMNYDRSDAEEQRIRERTRCALGDCPESATEEVGRNIRGERKERPLKLDRPFTKSDSLTPAGDPKLELRDE